MEDSNVRFVEQYSEEVQEIINKPPVWLVRWGITLLLLVVTLIALATYFIRYPEIITVPFTLTAADAPKSLLFRLDGKLQRLLVEDGQQVNSNQNLCYLESTGNHEQVIGMGRLLDKASQSVANNRWEALKSIDLDHFQNLGELQVDFQIFSQQVISIRAYLPNGFNFRKQELLEKDLRDLKEMEDNLHQQLEIQKRDFDLARDEFDVQEKLYNSKIISLLEFRKEKAKYLTREMPVKSLAALIIQNRTTQTLKQKEILELQNDVIVQKANFIQLMQAFKSKVSNWKQRHIMTATIPGRLSFSSPWQEQQQVSVGAEFAKIEPSSTKFRGVVNLPQANIGKLSSGQAVIIKLNGFPFREYGSLTGSLTKYSLTPASDGLYWGIVELSDSLVTKYGRHIPYRNGLTGTADIVTRERSLAERLFAMVKRGG